MRTIFLLIIISIPLSVHGQQTFPEAPEIWSEPVVLDTVFARPMQRSASASFTRNMDTVYFEGGTGIYMSYKKDGKWISRMKLNKNINDTNIAYRNPSISKDGKRLYFSAWKGYGGWDIWYSDWDEGTSDWGVAHNMGPVINNSHPDDQMYLYEVSKDTVFCLSYGSTDLFAWNYQSNSLVKIDSFWYHNLGIGDVDGTSMPSNHRKIYYGRGNYYNSPKHWYNGDVLVTYWDSTKNYWGNPLSLNINTIPKPCPDSSSYYGGGEFYPWISPNGKVLIFTKYDYEDTTNNSPKIYVSHLLVDENGDPVSVRDRGSSPYQSNKNCSISNYPNPFNSSTTIQYELPKEGTIMIKLYDSLGREITTVVKDKKRAGKYRAVIDFSRLKLSSGTYFCTLFTKDAVITNKLIYLK